MFKIISLNEENFSDFIQLLAERGEVLEEYYRWKYLKQPYQAFPTGFIAYNENVPIGCIGVINKIFIDNEQEHKATWFADWYVSNKGRKMGIGKKLLEEVYHCSPYGFGIPGPIHAQNIAKSVGYNFLSGYYTVTLIAKPFKYGFKAHTGSFLKKFIKGILVLAYFPGVNLSKQKQYLVFVKNKPNISLWIDQFNQLRKNVTHFERSINVIKWFLEMPSDLNKHWWYAYNINFFSCGFTEVNSHGIKTTKIVELLYTDKICLYSILNELKVILKKEGTEVMKIFCYIRNEDLKLFNKRSLFLEPICYQKKAWSDFFYLSMLDKESSWKVIKTFAQTKKKRQ